MPSDVVSTRFCAPRRLKSITWYDTQFEYPACAWHSTASEFYDFWISSCPFPTSCWWSTQLHIKKLHAHCQMGWMLYSFPGRWQQMLLEITFRHAKHNTNYCTTSSFTWHHLAVITHRHFNSFHIQCNASSHQSCRVCYFADQDIKTFCFKLVCCILPYPYIHSLLVAIQLPCLRFNFNCRY